MLRNDVYYYFLFSDKPESLVMSIDNIRKIDPIYRSALYSEDYPYIEKGWLTADMISAALLI